VARAADWGGCGEEFGLLCERLKEGEGRKRRKWRRERRLQGWTGKETKRKR
jgi:hypothetical protein